MPADLERLEQTAIELRREMVLAGVDEQAIAIEIAGRAFSIGVISLVATGWRLDQILDWIALKAPKLIDNFKQMKGKT